MRKIFWKHYLSTAEKSDRARLKSAGPKPLSRAGLGAIRRNGVASDARLSQQIILDFACWRSGQSLGEVDLAGDLEFGQPTGKIFADIIRVRNMPDRRHDSSDHRLAPLA